MEITRIKKSMTLCCGKAGKPGAVGKVCADRNRISRL